MKSVFKDILKMIILICKFFIMNQFKKIILITFRTDNYLNSKVLRNIFYFHILSFSFELVLKNILNSMEFVQ